ncbi:AraC family transcriptional regulator [Loigolactobacillus bifermentans]|uniref:HTH araC/xylS-type domain-containing protein n=1 Tax=Loigolactobacillus bifermentans DSM 20003 TaxID=1423726 RepID=A0A0R1GFB1_9LACO|nr:AraC family transcriptional regulator [Loigolactobacillus bifermentans]KRK32601.1 hypothetical protein FC07_GL002031 [Loigolactobacillus bifermentans DSM 20003]
MDKQALYEQNHYPDHLFPFEVYYVQRYGMKPAGRGFDDLHWHEEIQYTIAVKGALTVQVNGQLQTLQEGEGLFINSGILHTTKMMAQDGAYLSINFENKLLSFFLGSLMEQAYVLPYMTDYWLYKVVLRPQVAWQAQCLTRLHQITLAYQQKAFAWQYRIAIDLTEIWYQLITNVQVIHQPIKRHLQQQQRIQTLLRFVHEHYTEALTVSQFAMAAHISTAECVRCFNRFTGVAPYEYLQQYRIAQARKLLLRTSQSIEQIAQATGFSGTSNFIKNFKRRVDQTPLQYRRQQAP